MLFLALCIITCVQMRAADGDTFTANTQEGIVMSFKIISEIDKTVQVGNGSYASSISTSTSGEVTIPQQIEKSGVNYTVVSIGYHAFYYCEKLTSVTIPNSVKSIGEEAFNFCYGLTSVNIPNSVTNIGEDAFGYCKNLTSITIPQSVTSIGEAAFYGCGKLTTMNVDERNTKYDSRNQCNAIIETSTNMLISGFSTTIIPNSVTSIANYAFAYLNNLSMTSIVIPNSVKKIGNSSFRSCRNLTTIKIPNSVECIGDYAFESCSNLTSITISNGVTSIGQGAFSWCGLTSLTIPNSVTSIGRAAFSSCKGLTSVISKVTEPFSIDIMTFDNISSSCILTVPSGTKDAYIAKGWTESVFKGGIIEAPSPNITFADANVKSLCVANWDTNGDGELSEDEAAAVTNLGTVFKGNADIVAFDELRYFTGLTSIGDYAFRQCFNLRNIIIPNGVTSIGNSAFYECQNMESVIIPNSVVSIGNSAFWYCNYKLKSVAIPNSVKSIGSYAFEYCSALTSVTMGNSVTSIGYAAFRYSGLHSINIPSSVKQIESAAFEKCNGLTSIVSEMQSPSVRLDANSTIFSFSAVCILTVPYGTKETYIAKGWTEGVFRGGIVEAEPDPSLLNTLAVTNAEVCKGRQITFPVNMSNTKSITALQFEITLPAGVTISKCQLTDRKGEDHTASCKKQTNGNYQVTVLSLSKAVFSGTEGALVNLTLDAADNMTADDYDISLTNIELTTADTQAINPADVTATLTVSDVKIADADGNGKVSITDAVAIVSHILGDDIDGFVAAAADVDGNGRITITDAVAVVDMILNGSASAKGRSGMDEEELDPQ